MIMNIILEIWDIHEHNALMIDKNSFLKRFLFFGHQQFSF